MSHLNLLQRSDSQRSLPGKEGSAEHDLCIRGRSSVSRRVGVAMQAYIVALTTIICILQVSSYWSHSTLASECPNIDAGGDRVEYAFSRDLRYMSLDHQFDGLWDYGNMSTLRVQEPQLEVGGEIDASISMYENGGTATARETLC